jgi:3-mercaptopyruvate sulfurtransferase SseA
MTECAMAQAAMRVNRSPLAIPRRNMTYADLVERLGAIGIQETEVNIRNKIARGMFTAVFLFQCLEAIGVQEVRINGV